jgi:hypothetical protein
VHADVFHIFRGPRLLVLHALLRVPQPYANLSEGRVESWPIHHSRIVEAGIAQILWVLL